LNAKRVISLLSLFLFMIVGAGWWGYEQYQTKEQLRISLENQYQLSFRELVDDVENLEVETAKALVSNSPRQTMINLSDIWRNAYDAQGNLGRLPLSHTALLRTHKFLTQIGDFSYSIAKDTAPQITLKEGEWQTLHDLYNQARYLSAQLHELEMNIDKGRITWAEIASKSSNKLAGVSGNLINDGFRVIEKQMLDYPTLTYDGPFSDHLQAVPLGIPGDKITVSQALEIGEEFVAPGRKNQYIVKKTGEGKGRIATYSLEIKPKDRSLSGVFYLDVSQKGGEILWMVNNRGVEEKKISFQQALEKAQVFLEERGYKKMILTSYLEYQKSIIFSFAYQQDNVLVYSDLIKVKVALDNGQILGMEAVNYLMSHRIRQIPEPQITMAEARKKLNPRLKKVEREQLVLIPTQAHQEVLSYEFLVSLNSQRFLVYINALNGQEEDILRIVEDKNLLLAM